MKRIVTEYHKQLGCSCRALERDSGRPLVSDGLRSAGFVMRKRSARNRGDSVEPKSYHEILDRGYERGKDFLVRRGNLENVERCLLATPHGGGIEPGTTEILRAVARQRRSAYYHFDGMLRRGNKENLHITSTRFDEPKLMELLPQANFLLCFHGASGSSRRKIYVGGLHGRGRKRFLEGLNTDLAPFGFQAIDATTSKHAEEINGTSPLNITNGGRLRMGVQLEFSRGARLALFESLSRTGRRRPKEALRVLARSIDGALRKLTREPTR